MGRLEILSQSLSLQMLASACQRWATLYKYHVDGLEVWHGLDASKLDEKLATEYQARECLIIGRFERMILCRWRHLSSGLGAL